MSHSQPQRKIWRENPELKLIFYSTKTQTGHHDGSVYHNKIDKILMTSTVLLSTQTQLQAWAYKESIVFNTDFVVGVLHGSPPHGGLQFSAVCVCGKNLSIVNQLEKQ